MGLKAIMGQPRDDPLADVGDVRPARSLHFIRVNLRDLRAPSFAFRSKKKPADHAD